MGWRDTAGPGHKIAKTTPCKVDPGIDRGVSVSKPRDDLGQRRAGAILGRLCRRADMDEAGEFFICLQSEPVEHVAVERKPAGPPSRGRPQTSRSASWRHSRARKQR